MIGLQGKKAIELGSGCGLVGCIATPFGAQVILTNMPDRLRLLKKNVETNLCGDVWGSAMVKELIWGDDPNPKLSKPLSGFVFGSNVIYSEGAVEDLIDTLIELCAPQTIVILAVELQNDDILEYFLEAATKEFIIWHVDQTQWHPDYCSSRVVIYVMVKSNT